MNMIDKSNNEFLGKMKIDTFSATILGLISIGVYWVFLLKKWLVKNQNYKKSFYKSRFKELESNRFIEKLNNRTKKNIKIANIVGIMLAIGLVMFFIESYAELVLHKYPIPEDLFWFYVWLTFSLFAILLASIALQLRKTELEENEILTGEDFKRPWLLDGEGKRIYILAGINIILALGLLPFIIFPPILSSAINGYVEKIRINRTNP